MHFCSKGRTLAVISDGNLSASLVIEYVLIYHRLHNSHTTLITSRITTVHSI